MVRRLSYCIALFFIYTSLLANDFEVKSEDGKFGLFNHSTQDWAIPPQYEDLGWSDGTKSIQGEHIGARLNEKWALLKIDGKRVTQHIFVTLNHHLKNTFIASKRDRYSIRVNYGLINAKGNEIIPFVHQQLQIAQDLLIVSKSINGSVRTGLIDLQGKRILNFEYRSIQLLGKNRLEVKDLKSKSALFTINGDALTSFDYEGINAYQDNYFEVSYYGRKGLIDQDGKLIIPPLYADFKIENGEARGLPFPQWDLFEENKFQRSYFFDEVFELNNGHLAINTGNASGIINRNEEYTFYKEGNQFKSVYRDLAIIQDTQSNYKGIINSEGQVTLYINYDSLYFTTNFIAGSIDKPKGRDWQLFDFQGKAISVFNYDSIISEDDPFIAFRRGKYGLLNSTGDEASPFFYDDISEGPNGLYWVTYQGRQGVVDQQGHWVITPYNDSISFGKRRIYIKQGSQKKLAEFNGHIGTRTGNELQLLSQGYASGRNGRLSLFNFKNERLLDPTYDSIKNINDNLYALYRDQRIFFYRPSDGTDFELDQEISSIFGYAEGYVKIQKDGQYGFLDETGKLRIANRYQDAQDFSEGFAAVKLIGNWGYIDKSENLIIQPSFEEARPFFNKLAVVKQGEYYGLIAPTTEEVLATVYDDIRRNDDYIILQSRGLLGLADENGNLIKDCQYDEISVLSKDIFLVRKGDKFGVIDIKGADLVPISYSRIKAYGKRFYGVLTPQWERIKTSN